MPSGKSVLITGCSTGGIGSALALAFASRSFHVFATARHPSKISSSLTSQPNVTVLTLDVTNPSHIAQAVQAVADETGGRLDYLVNNAGRNHFMPLLDEDVEDAKQIFEVNVWGPLRLMKAFSPLLVRARGTIVNVESVSGRSNIPWMGTYASSKATLELLSSTLRLELLPFNVHVLNIVTATVQTNGLTYLADLSLPEDSLYKSIETTIRGRAQGVGGPKKRLDPVEWAENVVGRLLSGEGKGGTLWGPGFTAGFVRFATAWLPQWVLDSMWIKGTGIDQMMSQSR